MKPVFLPWLYFVRSMMHYHILLSSKFFSTTRLISKKKIIGYKFVVLMIVTQEYIYSGFSYSPYWLWWCIVIMHIEALNSCYWLNLCSKYHFNYTNVCLWMMCVNRCNIFFMVVWKILVELTIKPDNCFLKYLTVQQLYLTYVKMLQ